MNVLVLGATGGIGARIVLEGVRRGHRITAQSRSLGRLADRPGGVLAEEADPCDPEAMARIVRGQDAVVFALGESSSGPTSLFSAATNALLPAMRAAGCRRLVAITGVGAGETRGHGGFFYDRIVFPLFTRHRYADKDRQEALIRESGLDWVIVRPAPFNNKPASTPLRLLTHVDADTRLTRISRDEVAKFVLDQLGETSFLGKAVFIGHS
jgi:putative NADH-flavin reductase